VSGVCYEWITTVHGRTTGNPCPNEQQSEIQSFFLVFSSYEMDDKNINLCHSIGFLNYRYFLLFTFYLFVGSGYAVRKDLPVFSRGTSVHL
jgi:hypothetical protein